MAADEQSPHESLQTERTLVESPEDTTPPEEEATLVTDSIEDVELARKPSATPDDTLSEEDDRRNIPDPIVPPQDATLMEDGSAPTGQGEDEKTMVESETSGAHQDRTFMMEPSMGMPSEETSGETMIISAADQASDDSPQQRSESASDESGTTVASDVSDQLPGDASNEATLMEPAEGSDSWTGTGVDEGAASSDPYDQTLVHDSGPARVSATATDYDPPEKNSGDLPSLGRFEILKLLGQGAFGAVYLAHDPHLDRKVAIKIAKTGVLVGKQDVDRFMREARSAAQLRHPNIVPVYEVGQLPNTNFIAYEYIEGRTLGDLMKETKKLPHKEAATYMKKIADGLHYAHEHGIVHRDMKPDNVLLDVNSEPHIADFGLARRDEGDTTRTREGMFMGTPSYMSPEQASGKAHLADARSDVWSLGVMLQEMLTGVRPFRGNVTEVLVAVQNYEPPPIRTLDKSIPEDLSTIVEKCLEKKPDERYASAEVLSEELERWLRDEPILARPIGVFGRTLRWTKRNPQVASLLGVIAVVLIVGALLSTIFGVSATRARNLAHRQAIERAEAQLTSIRTADAASLPVLITSLGPYRGELRNELLGLVGDDDLTATEQSRIRLAAATLYVDEPQHAEIVKQSASDLLNVTPGELIVRSEMLQPFREQVEGPLWAAARDEVLPQRRRFQALAALASLNSDLPNWPTITGDMVAEMLTMNPLELSNWLPAVRTIREQLEGPLTKAFTQGTDSNSQYRAAIVLGELFRDTPETLIALVPQADPKQLGPLLEALKPRAGFFAGRLTDQLTQTLATANGSPPTAKQMDEAVNFALALLGLDRGEPVWPLLDASPDQHLRTSLIHEIVPAGISWEQIATRMEWEQEGGVIAALCLVLGEYGDGELLPSDREQLSVRLLKLFNEHPHAGVHSAIDWVLRRWGKGKDVDAAIATLKSKDRNSERNWHVDNQGVTFSVIEPETFVMGAAPDERPGNESEEQHRRLIPRTYGLSIHEVTLAEYLKFDPEFDLKRVRRFAPDDDCPAVNIKWYDAAAYCRWLSEKEGFAEHEMCYPSLDEFAALRTPSLQRKSLNLPDDLLDRPGYRLPTAAEWEYAARAGTRTRRPFGNSDRYLGKYVWYQLNTDGHTWPTGLLKPNTLGLFDVQGNALEWCHNYWYETLPPAGPGGVIIDGADTRDSVTRECRGGSYRYSAETIRVAYTDYISPASIFQDLGFRIARTYPTARQSQPKRAE